MNMTTKSGVSVYEDRTDCPARFHDSYSSVTKAGCVCPTAVQARSRYTKRQRHGLGEPAYVDPTGTQRRLRALVAIGYPTRTLATLLGWTGNIGRVLWGDHLINRKTARRVAEIYDELSEIPGPSDASRRAAKRAGYVPPAAWDDETIDDPSAEPNTGAAEDDIVDDVAIGQVLDGKLSFKALRDSEKEALFREHLAGWGINRIRARFGMSNEAVKLWRGRAFEGEQVAA